MSVIGWIFSVALIYMVIAGGVARFFKWLDNVRDFDDLAVECRWFSILWPFGVLIILGLFVAAIASGDLGEAHRPR